MSRTNVRFAICLMLICLTAAVVPASAQHFKQITGTPLSQIAAGRKEVWGLYNSQIYRFNPNTESFDPIPGALTQIAVGGGTLMQTDEVWGINNGEVYRFNFNTNTFDSVPGGPKPCKFCIVVSFSQIAVGAGYEDNCHPYEVWVLTSLGNPYRYNYCTSLFDNTPTLFDIGGTETHVAFTRIAVNAGSVWGLSASTVPALVFEYSQQSGWGQANDLGSFQQISIGINGVWALDSTGEVWNWQSGLFRMPIGGYPGGAANQLAAGGDGVWVIYDNSLVARYDFQNGSFSSVPLPAGADSAAQIAVGSGAGVWMVDISDQVYTLVRP
jgi:Tectonin domain